MTLIKAMVSSTSVPVIGLDVVALLFRVVGVVEDDVAHFLYFSVAALADNP